MGSSHRISKKFGFHKLEGDKYLCLGCNRWWLKEEEKTCVCPDPIEVQRYVDTPLHQITQLLSTSSGDPQYAQNWRKTAIRFLSSGYDQQQYASVVQAEQNPGVAIELRGEEVPFEVESKVNQIIDELNWTRDLLRQVFLYLMAEKQGEPSSEA